MPRKSDPRIKAIQVSVMAALRVSGLRKMGMPLEIASTPVIAEQPVANERRMTKMDNGSMACTVGVKCPMSGWCRKTYALTNPTMMSREELAMKRYVGRAKIDPDSRIPRRLRTVITI